MGRVFRPWYYTGSGADRKRVRTEDWYAEWQRGGKTARKRIGTKSDAIAALAKFEAQESRRKAGVPDHEAEGRAWARPVAELIVEYLASLRNRERSPAYLATVEKHLDAISAGARWFVWADVTADTLSQFLADLRAERDGRKGISPATANGYLRSAKGFAKWYAAVLRAPSPLAGSKPLNEQTDRRRTRRILSDAEFALLLERTAEAPAPHNSKIGGRDRAALYRTAAHTGLRAGELASLKPEHFALDAKPPTVTCDAQSAKGRRVEPVPLTDALVAFLREYLAGKHPGERIWPGNWAAHRRQVRWLERDATRAGIEGRVTFHSLRRRFVTKLIRSGADVDQVRRLARHKSVATTLNYYAESELKELAAVVNRVGE